MKKVLLCWLSLFLVVGLSLSAHGQSSSEPADDDAVQRQESPPAIMIIGDLVVIRPLGVIFTAAGVLGTVASLPFTVPSRSVGTVAQKLIADPFTFTFTRPLGLFSPELDVP
jgi:hypothetical protein